MFQRNGRVAAVCAVSVLALAGTSRGLDAADLVGEWKTQGKSDTLGSYTGTLRLKEKSGEVLLDATLKLANGKTKSWTAKGKLVGNTISFEGHTRRGLTGILSGGADKSRTWKGSYTISSDGRSIAGTWEIADGTKGSETSTRDAAPGPAADLMTIVDGDGKDASAAKKSKDGVLLAVNVDDDDKDGGKGGDGEVNIVSDKDDTDGVAGEDDLVQVKLKRPAAAPAGATFEVSYGARIAVWTSATKQPGTQVKSGGKVPANASSLWVEGLAASDAGTPETLGVKLVTTSGAVVGEDAGKFLVARSAFMLVGHGNAGTYALSSQCSSRAENKGGDPYLLRGKDAGGKPVAWAVYIWNTEKGAKIALSTQGSVVAYDGHSNFGLGYAFETNFKNVREFMNIANDQMPVNWVYLRDHQEHPGLLFADSDYADDASTPKFSDPVGVGATFKGSLTTYSTVRYPLSGGNGTRYNLTRSPSHKWEDYHYLMDPSNPSDPEGRRILVKAGSRDMPAKRWSKLFLNSCYSGSYYNASFGGHGTLFFTTDECSSPQTSGIFLMGNIDGLADAAILTKLNKAENVNDFMSFGN